MPDVIIDDEYHELGQTNIQQPGKSYPGDSDRKEHTDWRDLHLAIQRAAKAAAEDPSNGEGWYDVSHIRILVGNPNVKIYSVVLTKTPGT